MLMVLIGFCTLVVFLQKEPFRSLMQWPVLGFNERQREEMGMGMQKDGPTNQPQMEVKDVLV